MNPKRLLCLLFAVVLAGPVRAETLPAGARARLGTTNLWHGPVVRGLLFAADGKSFYSLSDGDSVVRQWDVSTGQELRAFTHNQRLVAFALSHDGRLLATATVDHTIRLWSTSLGETIASWPRKLAPQTLAFAPDSKTLAVLPGDEAETLSLLDAASGKEMHKLKFETIWRDDNRGIGFRRRMQAWDDDEHVDTFVTYSPDGKHLALVAGTNITLWDLATMKKIRRYEVGRTRGEVAAMQFAGDGQTLFSVTAGGVQRWDINSIEALETLKGNDPLLSLSVSANGNLIAACGGPNLFLWHGKEARPLTLEGDFLTTVACSPDGKTAVTGDREGVLRVWEAETGKERLLPGPRPQFRSLAFLGAEAALVSADERLLTHWDAAGKETQRLKVGKEQNVNLMLSPDGRTLVLRREDGKIRLLDTGTGEIRATLEGESRRYSAFVFSADSRLLAVMEGNSQRPVSVYDLRGKEVRQIADQALLSDSFVFLPDGRSLITANSNTALSMWELATGKPRRTLHLVASTGGNSAEDNEAMVPWRVERNSRDKYLQTPETLAVSSDARLFAIIQGSTVSLLDLHTGKRLGRVETPGPGLVCIAFSPDGKVLVGAGNDRLLYFWDPATMKEIGTLAGHRGTVRQLVFAADSKTLATASDDRTALLWDMPAALEVAQHANRVVPAVRSMEQLWADLGSDDPQRADAALRELTARPKETLTMLKEHLHPVKVMDAKQLAKLVAELDDGDFGVREAAAAELEKTGEQARDALKAALAGKPSPELKRGAGDLLKKLDEHTYSAEVVRDLRALETLEAIGGAEAKKLLTAMASGPANDPRTQDASSALERFQRK
jgi:WD40 repeat protein